MNETRDPEAPFIAQDGLEYEDLAAYILQQPIRCWRNHRIQALRAQGRSEALVREWIKGYDGEDPTPSSTLPAFQQADRAVRAADRYSELVWSL